MQTALWIVGVYVFICVAGHIFHRQFMYFPDPVRLTPAESGLKGVEEVELKTPDGETLVAWYAPSQAGKPTLLYFHGNGGAASYRSDKIAAYQGDGLGAFYLNARSYGGSSGRPSERANVADGVLAYDHLVGLGLRPEDIVLYGESLGTGVAVQVALQRQVRAVVLEAPLTSTVDVGRQIYWFLPLGWILTDKYRTIEHIKSVTVPLLVLHGEKDAVIPVAHGKRIYNAANEPKSLVLLPEAGHSDHLDHNGWAPVRSFLDALPAQ
ncbi:MAG: alpha/beta hydrolase [Methyloligellaceae bacterium]